MTYLEESRVKRRVYNDNPDLGLSHYGIIFSLTIPAIQEIECLLCAKIGRLLLITTYPIIGDLKVERNCINK